MLTKFAVFLVLLGLTAIVLGVIQGAYGTLSVRNTTSGQKGALVRQAIKPDEAGLIHRDLLWSKGWTIKHQDYALTDTEAQVTRAEALRVFEVEQGIVWVKLGTHRDKTGDLQSFADHVLDTVTEDFVLITTDGDLTVPDDLEEHLVQRLLNCDRLKGWYSQNLNRVHALKKMHHLPIGLDLHTVRAPLKSMNDKRDLFIRLSRGKADRTFRIWCDAHLTQNGNFGNPRKRMGQALPQLKLVDGLEQAITQEEIWRKYQKYQFVISVTGNGLDCHRTWEVLGLGATVITFSTGLDPVFQGYRVIILPTDSKGVPLAGWIDLLNDEDWLKKQQQRVEKYAVPSLSRETWLAKARALLDTS